MVAFSHRRMRPGCLPGRISGSSPHNHLTVTRSVWGVRTGTSEFPASRRLPGLTCADKRGTADVEVDFVHGRTRVAGQLAVPAVLGLVIGVVLAYQSGTSNSGLTQIPLGTYVTPTASETAAALTGQAASMKSNTTCDIIVPANPLSAQGLATPYELTGPKGMTPAQSGGEMSNGAKLGAFV